VFNLITCWSVTHWGLTPPGMPCPQRTKSISSVRVLEREFPKVHLKIRGKAMTFGDVTHVLDTKGFDGSAIPPGNTNESHLWSLMTPLPEFTTNDVDGDGATDLVWHHSPTGAVLVWLLNGAAPPFPMTLGTLSDLGWQIK